MVNTRGLPSPSIPKSPQEPMTTSSWPQICNRFVYSDGAIHINLLIKHASVQSSSSKVHRNFIFPFKVSQRFYLLMFPHERFQESPPIIILITNGFRDPIISFKVPQRSSFIMFRHERFQ